MEEICARDGDVKNSRQTTLPSALYSDTAAPHLLPRAAYYMTTTMYAKNLCALFAICGVVSCYVMADWG